MYDVCTAVCRIIEKGQLYEIYNIGSNDENEISILEVSEMICKYYKNGLYSKMIDKHTFINDRPFNDKRYFITNSKLKSIGWDCTINLKDYIQNI